MGGGGVPPNMVVSFLVSMQPWEAWEGGKESGKKGGGEGGWGFLGMGRGWGDMVMEHWGINKVLVGFSRFKLIGYRKHRLRNQNVVSAQKVWGARGRGTKSAPLGYLAPPKIDSPNHTAGCVGGVGVGVTGLQGELNQRGEVPSRMTLCKLEAPQPP